MRSEEDYKKLIKGYSLSLSLLKKVFPDLYAYFIEAMDSLDKSEARFAEIVRDLKIDFINENDGKEAQDAKVGLFSDGKKRMGMYAMLYNPSDSYSLAMLRREIHKFKNKQILCEIFPLSAEPLRDNQVLKTFRISKVDENNSVHNLSTYYVGFVEDLLVVMKQDKHNPEKSKSVFEIKRNLIKTLFIDFQNSF